MSKKVLALVVGLSLLAAMALPAAAAGNPFADVPPTHWAYETLVRLAELGIVSGYPEDGLFKGNRSLTRYEAAILTARTLAVLEQELAAQVQRSVQSLRDGISKDVEGKLSAAQEKAVADALAKLQADIEKAKAALEAEIKAALEARDSALGANIQSAVDAAVQKAVAAQVEQAVAKAVQPSADGQKVVVERVVVEKPVETVVERPFEMTPAAEAAISQLVTKLVSEQLAAAKVEPQVIEKVIERVVEPKVEEKIIETKVIEKEVVNGLTDEQIRALVEAKSQEVAAAVRQELTGNVEQLAKSIAEAVVADKLAAFGERLAAVDEKLVMAGVATDAVKADVAVVKEDLKQANAALLWKADQAALDAVRGDLAALSELVAAKTGELASAIEQLSAEFETELAVIGVRVSQLEYLFSQIEPRVAALEQGQSALQEDQKKTDAEVEALKSELAKTQQAAAATKADLDKANAEIAALKAAKPVVTWSGRTEFSHQTTNLSGTADKFWKDPRKKNFDGDSTTGDADDYYSEQDKASALYVLTANAQPADGVKVSATLAAANGFGADSVGLYFSSYSNLSVTTPGTLRSLKIGYWGRSTIADANWFNKYTLHTDGVTSSSNQGLLLDVKAGNLDAHTVYYREADGKYILGVAAKYPVSDALKLTGNYVRFENLPGATGTGAYARDQVASVQAEGKLGSLNYKYLLAIDDSSAEGSATELSASTKLGSIDLGYTYGAVGANWGSGPRKTGKTLKADKGDLLADQRKYVLTASAPLFGVKAGLEFGRKDNDVSKGDFDSWHQVSLSEVKLLGLTAEGYLKNSVDENGVATVTRSGKAATTLLGAKVTGQLYSRSIADADDLSAYRLDGSRDVQVLLPLSVSAMWGHNSTIDRPAAKLSVAIKDGIKLSNSLRLDASYSMVWNAITKDEWTVANSRWTVNDEQKVGTTATWNLTSALTVKGGVEFRNTGTVAGNWTDDYVTTSLGTSYKLKAFGADVTLAYDYKLGSRNGYLAEPLNRYTIEAKRDLFGAAATAKYVYTTGDWDGADVTKTYNDDTVSEWSLTYPVFKGANLTFKGNYVRSKPVLNSHDATNDYAVLNLSTYLGIDF